MVLSGERFWHSSGMSLEPGATPTPYRPLAILLSCVLVLAVALTWAYLAMRAVMDVGGTCAEGGPYEIAQPCPDGAWMISVAIPVLIAAAMLGSYVAFRLTAPNLLVPMWTVLFGTLGWNFLEYGFSDDGPVWGWIVCGAMFELMALPGAGADRRRVEVVRAAPAHRPSGAAGARAARLVGRVRGARGCRCGARLVDVRRVDLTGRAVLRPATGRHA